MAVAAADFYSYAKATGTPLPKSKQEEAQLAPAVNNWKKSRLKAPERERDSGDLGNVLGGGAIAAGLAGAALYGYRRGWGDSPAPRKPAPTGNLPSEIPTRVYTDEQRPVDLKGTRNKETGTYRASVNEIQKEQPQAGTQVRDIAGEEALWDANYWANFHAIKRANPSWNIADIDKQAVLAAKQATNQPIRKGYVPGPATDNRINLQEIPESSPVEFSPLEYVKSTGAVEPTVQVTNVDTPRDFLALRDAPTYKDTTSPEQLYVQQKLAELQTGPKALESLGDEQIDVIRGTVANAKLYPQTTSEVRRQEARMRTNDKIAQEGIDELLGREFVDDTLVAQQKTIAPELADQSLESANSGYQQMDDKLDRSVQRDTDSIAVGSQAVEIEKTQKALLSQAELDKINQVGITGTRIAGPSNVQSIRNNQTLTRQGPVPEVEVPEQTFLKTQLEQRLDKLQQETTELKAIGQNLERAGQLMSGGTRAVNTPGTTTFDNAMAADMVARAGIKPRITSQYYQKNISLPKTMRQAVDTGSRDPGRIIDTKPKGGGGRKVTAYNPDYQQLSTVGPYGIERANYPRADITKRPTEMPISPRTGKPIQEFRDRPWPPSSSPEVAKQSMEISENIRKIYNSGRPDAQQQVQAYIQGLRKGQQF